MFSWNHSHRYAGGSVANCVEPAWRCRRACVEHTGQTLLLVDCQIRLTEEGMSLRANNVEFICQHFCSYWAHEPVYKLYLLNWSHIWWPLVEASLTWYSVHRVLLEHICSFKWRQNWMWWSWGINWQPWHLLSHDQRVILWTNQSLAHILRLSPCIKLIHVDHNNQKMLMPLHIWIRELWY